VSDAAAREILVGGARALAHGDDLADTLTALLDAIATGFNLQSAAIVVAGERPDEPRIVATFGLDEGAKAGLAEAMRRPTHPVTRTFGELTPTYDVAPTVPGGPALRSHLPLVVTRAGKASVVGVLALAHDDPTDPTAKPILEAAAELAAVAIEHGTG